MNDPLSNDESLRFSVIRAQYELEEELEKLKNPHRGLWILGGVVYLSFLSFLLIMVAT